MKFIQIGLNSIKKLSLVFLLLFLHLITFAQQKEKAEELVNEGIAYHDEGDFASAIKLYNKALELDKNNLFALTEKAYSSLMLRKYDEAIQCCQMAIKKHPDNQSLESVYVTMGNAYDALNKPDKSLETYDKGLKKFPNYFLLYFNKGITLTNMRKIDDAIDCFQKSVILNPNHASSHNAIAKLSEINNKKIPAFLAYCRFFVLEPQSERAKSNFENMGKIINGNVKKTGENAITISINSNTFDKKGEQNDFSSTELMLAMESALDHDQKYTKQTEVEKFIRKFETICSSLKERKKNNQGFYWDYYVPYFIEMKEHNLITTFAYIVFTSSENEEVNEWLNAHKKELDEFNNWSTNFKWKTNKK